MRELAQEYGTYQDAEQTVRFCIGCILGELSGRLFPWTREEQHALEEESIRLLGYTMLHQSSKSCRSTEEPPEHFREVVVSRDARGTYYCSFVYEESKEQVAREGIVAFDLGIKTLAVGYTDTGRFYHIGGFKGYRWYNSN